MPASVSPQGTEVDGAPWPPITTDSADYCLAGEGLLPAPAVLLAAGLLPVPV